MQAPLLIKSQSHSIASIGTDSVSLGRGNGRHPMPCQYSAGNAVTIFDGLGLPEKATRRGTAKCRPNPEAGRGASTRNRGKTSMAGGVSSIYGEGWPVTGCVAAPMRLPDVQGAQNASVSSPVTAYIHVPCLALLAQEVRAHLPASHTRCYWLCAPTPYSAYWGQVSTYDVVHTVQVCWQRLEQMASAAPVPRFSFAYSCLQRIEETA